MTPDKAGKADWAGRMSRIGVWKRPGREAAVSAGRGWKQEREALR